MIIYQLEQEKLIICVSLKGILTLFIPEKGEQALTLTQNLEINCLCVQE